MNGNAPNWSTTGSQIVVRRNDRPNLCKDSRDCVTSSKTINPTTATRATAQATTAERNAPSVKALLPVRNLVLASCCGGVSLPPPTLPPAPPSCLAVGLVSVLRRGRLGGEAT